MWYVCDTLLFAIFQFLKVIWDVSVFIQATHEGLARKKGVKLNWQGKSFVLSMVSWNFTVRLNEARLVVKRCFVVKTDRPDPEHRIPDKWEKITFPNKIVRKLKRPVIWRPDIWGPTVLTILRCQHPSALVPSF